MTPIMRRVDAAAAGFLKRLPDLLVLLVLLGGAWHLAGWVWRFVPAPAPDARPLVVPDNPQGIVARHWFGEVPAVTRARAGTAGETSAPAPVDEIRLIGSIAGGKRPAALLMVGRTLHEVLLGETFADGFRLKSVAAETVVVERQGRDVSLSLYIPRADAATPASPHPGGVMPRTAENHRPRAGVNRP